MPEQPALADIAAELFGPENVKTGAPPKMGSENYPVLEDAPGSYVLEK